jgi:NAD-dependent SIR2 family protein deacetylase
MEEPTTIQSLEKIAFLARRVEAMREAILDPKGLPALWVGAGFSAKYGRNPTWYIFLSKFLAENFAPSHEDYALIDALLKAGKLDLAVEMLVRKRRSEFYKSIESAFAKSHSSLPLFLRNWNLHDVITTNYDTLTESCFDKHDVLLPSSGMHALLSSRPKIVKIHGTAAEPSTCVASITNYVRSYDNNLEWYLTNVFQTRTVVFFGSSMNEAEPYFDILRCFARTTKCNLLIIASSP